MRYNYYVINSLYNVLIKTSVVDVEHSGRVIKVVDNESLVVGLSPRWLACKLRKNVEQVLFNI